MKIGNRVALVIWSIFPIFLGVLLLAPIQLNFDTAIELRDKLLLLSMVPAFWTVKSLMKESMIMGCGWAFLSVQAIYLLGTLVANNNPGCGAE